MKPLAHPNFRLLFAARTVSMFGTALAPVALAFAVASSSGSPSVLGLAFAAVVTPQVAFTLVGGLWSDRLPRHLVMVGSDLVSGGAQGAVAALFLLGHANIAAVIALSALRGAASAFFGPASSGLVPQVVPQDGLQQANALLRLATNATSIGGAGVGGLLVVAFGPGWALGVDAASYVVGALLVACMSFPALGRPRQRPFLRELREGWDEFTSRTWLWAVVTQFALLNAFATGAFLVLGPFAARRSLGGAGAWGLIVAAQAAGMVLGSLAGLRVRPRRPLVAGVLALSLTALPLALLGAHATLSVVVVAAVLSGLGVELMGVLWETTLQRHVPEERLSRVASYDIVGSFALVPVGVAAMGGIASVLGLDRTLYLAAGLAVASSALVAGLRSVRELDAADELPAGAPVSI